MTIIIAKVVLVLLTIREAALFGCNVNINNNPFISRWVFFWSAIALGLLAAFL